VGRVSVSGRGGEAVGGASEAADREGAWQARPSDQIEDRGPALGIASGYQHACRLVQRQVVLQPDRLDRLAVDRHAVGLGIDQKTGGWRRTAVDPYRPRSDQHLGGPPPSDAPPRPGRGPAPQGWGSLAPSL